MEKIEVILLSDKADRRVVKVTNITWPGVFIPGETLAMLYTFTVLTMIRLQECNSKAAAEVEASLNIEGLAHCIVEYEEALKAHGISLPYDPELTSYASSFIRRR